MEYGLPLALLLMCDAAVCVCVCCVDLSRRVDTVKEENLKLKSENLVLGQYIENLMEASAIFQSTVPSTKPHKSVTNLPWSLYVCLSISLPVCLSLSVYVCLSISLPVCLSVSLSSVSSLHWERDGGISHVPVHCLTCQADWASGYRSQCCYRRSVLCVSVCVFIAADCPVCY